MTECAVPECDKTPPNPAVPACNDHLCEKCRMGVIAGSDPKAPRYMVQCAACLDRLSIRNAIDEFGDSVDKLHGRKDNGIPMV